MRMISIAAATLLALYGTEQAKKRVFVGETEKWEQYSFGGASAASRSPMIGVLALESWGYPKQEVMN